jgi:hypothetical protein
LYTFSNFKGTTNAPRWPPVIKQTHHVGLQPQILQSHVTLVDPRHY